MEILAALLGFVGGVLAGLFGVGGGILFVPTLVLVLGLTQIHAEATSLLAILPTVIVGTWRQHRYGNVDLRAGLLVGIGAIAGVEGGVQIAKALPEDTLRRLFAVLMFLVAASLAWRALRQKPTYASGDEQH
ncbi:MAG: sulfite exporter TauE/SafE family protein [Gaiellaceae bacterium]